MTPPHPTGAPRRLGQSLETVAYLARNWKFESTPLQRRVSDEPVLARFHITDQIWRISSS
jgi:hypothetical protein